MSMKTVIYDIMICMSYKSMKFVINYDLWSMKFVINWYEICQTSTKSVINQYEICRAKYEICHKSVRNLS